MLWFNQIRKLCFNQIQEPKASPDVVAGTVQANFDDALALQQRGQLAQAQELYTEILRNQPKHADALHFLGVLAMQTKDFPRAVELIDKAIAIAPDYAAAYANRGLALQSLKHLDDAVASYDKAIAFKPDYAEAYCNRGNALKELKQLDAAVASYDKAIAVVPDLAVAHANRGMALKELKQFDAAVESYDKAIAIVPDFVDAYYNRGNALRELKQLEAAVASYDTAVAIKLDHAAAYYNRGLTLEDLKRTDAAVASYDKAIATRPDFAEAYCNRGNALTDLKQLDAAVASYDKAIAIKPDFVDAYYNRGMALKELRQLDAAVASYDRAVAIKPDFAEAYCDRGNVLRDLKQLDAAVASYDKAIAQEFAEANWNKSLTLLLAGDFKNGWVSHEWRWKCASFTTPRRNFRQPLWLGKESIAGKTILLHSEQGLGDTIQFCRYVKLVSDLGARVVLEVDKSLASLLEELAGVSELIVRGDALPFFDYHCPLLSLPLAFKTELSTIPCSAKYISTDALKMTHWKNKLDVKTKPRVGLAWSGSTWHKNDHNRSIFLSELMHRLPSGFQYVSLQKETRQIDKLTLESNPHIIRFGGELNDFTDTAALCELMDVVISVDTSVAHLAGALGTPTWILLPFIPDWRWLLDRDDSPWYTSVKLYRQPTIGDWNSVFAKVGSDLAGVV